MTKGRIVYVGGSKGGTGKSLVAIAVTDYLRHTSQDVLLVETDTENQDVAQAYQFLGNDLCVMPLKERNDWVEFMNFAGGNQNRTIVVNTAAGSMEDLRKSAEIINHGLAAMGTELITLWPINRQRYVLNALNEFLDIVNVGSVHVLRNLLYGDASRFVLFNELAGLRQRIMNRGGDVHDFPDLADRVADRVYTDRLAIEVGLQDGGPNGEPMKIGDRSELFRWRKAAHECVKAVL